MPARRFGLKGRRLAGGTGSSRASGAFPLHGLSVQLRRDTWGGRNRIELQIEDAADLRAQ